MDIIELSEQVKFELVPEGEQELKIVSVEAKPKARPQIISVVYEHANGGIITVNYDLFKKIKTKKGTMMQIGLVQFSELARVALGDDKLKEFSISKDLPKLENVTIKATVKHTEPNEKGYVYANIKKILEKVKGDDPIENAVTYEELDDIDF